MHTRCVAVDLDFTLTHFTHPIGVLFRMLRRYGIAKDVSRTCYTRVKDGAGFTPERFLDEVVAETRVTLYPRTTLREAFDKWFRGSFAPYSDSLDALGQWHAAHIPVCIVTAGAEEFQRRKIESTLLASVCDEIFVVAHTHEKAPVLRQVIDRFGPQVVMIDDKESELDALREAGFSREELDTVHINRSDSPYRSQKPQFSHREIVRLVEALPDTAIL